MLPLILAWSSLAAVAGGDPVAAAKPLPVVQPAASPRSLDWNEPVWCVRLAPTKEVPSGDFRVQCDVKERRCLAAPRTVLVDGVAGEQPLARVRDECWQPFPGDTGAEVLERARLEGWPFDAAIAEAPPGWYRDERGRVMQVNFDLGRRVYFGGSWSPYYRPDTGAALARGRPELGVSITWLADDERHQHRLHFVEGAAWLGVANDLRLELSSARYDSSRRHERPPLWLSTFVGKPRRFDLDLDVTWAAEVGRFEVLGGRTFLGVVEADVVVDLWHSPDLDSFVRARVGPALEVDLTAKAAYFRPAVALEADVTLDRDGFHHLTASALGEKLFFEPVVAGRPGSPQRLKLKVGYEVILAALNDYPLSLVLDARATWRDDVPTLRGWEFQANAGLRFSLWAPARYSAELRGLEPLAPPSSPAPVPAPSDAPEPAPATDAADVPEATRAKDALNAPEATRPPRHPTSGLLAAAPEVAASRVASSRAVPSCASSQSLTEEEAASCEASSCVAPPCASSRAFPEKRAASSVASSCVAPPCASSRAFPEKRAASCVASSRAVPPCASSRAFPKKRAASCVASSRVIPPCFSPRPLAGEDNPSCVGGGELAVSGDA